MIIVGQAALARDDGHAILAHAARAAMAAGGAKSPRWKVLNVLHAAAARVAGLDLGFVPSNAGKDTEAMVAAAESGGLDVLYLLGADEIDTGRLGNAFVIYQGSHGDKGANRADVILPGAAYTEKSATYCNTEGRVQMTERAVFPPGEAKEDWKILRALSSRLKKSLSYDTLEALRLEMYKVCPHLAALDEVGTEPLDALTSLAKQTGEVTSAPMTTAIKDFYLSNAVTRASPLMAELSALKAASDRTSQLQAAE